MVDLTNPSSWEAPWETETVAETVATGGSLAAASTVLSPPSAGLPPAAAAAVVAAAAGGGVPLDIRAVHGTEVPSISANPIASQTGQLSGSAPLSAGGLAPLGGRLAPACTPELLRKIDEILPNLFDRYH